MMAFDPNANAFVWFGGWNGSVTLNQTWELNASLDTWTELSPPVSPPPRADGAFVYDPIDQRFFLFGGWLELPNGTVHRLSDMWAYSLALDRWSQLFPAVAPSPRSDAAVGFDTVDRVLVLFGGFSGASYLGDTWSYVPSTGVWSPLPPRGAAPSPRADGRMTYDAGLDEFVLFGGNDFSGPNLTFHHLNDTWTLEYGTRSWAELQTGPAPPARDYAVQVVDPTNGWLLLYGGFGNRTILSDLWALDPSNETWWPLFPARPPPGRYAGAGGFDDGNQAFVLFGGLGNQGLLNDTWVLGPAPLPASAPGFPWVLLLEVAAPVGVLAAGLGWWIARSRGSKRRGPGPSTPPGGGT